MKVKLKDNLINKREENNNKKMKNKKMKILNNKMKAKIKVIKII
jgi:hypothetical protein